MMVMTSQNATQNSTTYFWSMSGDSLYRHREELRLELYTPDNEALDSKIAKEIIEDYSGRFQEKINLLEEQYKSQATLCIRSSRSSVFFFFQTQRERMSVRDLPNVGLHSDNLKTCSHFDGCGE